VTVCAGPPSKLPSITDRLASDRPGRSVDAGRLWTGGVATALVAALVALVGVLIARGLFEVPVLAPTDEGTLGNASTWRLAAFAAAAALLAGTALLLADYVVARNVVMDNLADNRVVTALRAAGDRAGPILGVPVREQVSATSYVAALSHRRALNAYNQTPVRWLDERMERLEPLNRGVADPVALEVLRTTGTRQVLVVDEARVFASGEWEQTVRGLVRSGRFRLVERDGPLALLEVVGGQSPTRGSEQPGPGSDPTREL
jgi:hypothetical protein